MLVFTKGRMYDYNNGRFLSVDPFIQSPSSTQSMNPYTYIFNNPLSGTDPTGYVSKDDKLKGGALQLKTKKTASIGSNIRSNVTTSVTATTTSGESVTVSSTNGNAATVTSNGKASSGVKGTNNLPPSAGTQKSDLNSQKSIQVGPTCTAPTQCTNKGSSARKTFDKNRNHVFDKEILVTPEQEEILKSNNDFIQQVTTRNEQGFAITSESDNLIQNARASSSEGCATLCLVPDTVLQHHIHLAKIGDEATTLARELPGPSDLSPLVRLGIPVAITTPTGALRVIEVREVKSGVFEPRLRTLLPGSDFSKAWQIKRLETWRKDTNPGSGNLKIVKKAGGGR